MARKEYRKEYAASRHNPRFVRIVLAFGKDNAYRIVAANGHLNVLQWVKENESLKQFFNAEICESIIAGGHLDALKWLRENECPWDPRTCSMAAVRVIWTY
jgi:hypothetical protein